MSMTLNERNPNVAIIPLGTRASSASIVVPGMYFRKHSRIKEVRVADRLGITKSSSNYVTFTLQDNSGSPVAYAAAATSDNAAVAVTPLLMPLSTPVGDVTNQPEADVPAGTTLNVSIAGTGTAVLTDAVLMVEWYPL